MLSLMVKFEEKLKKNYENEIREIRLNRHVQRQKIEMLIKKITEMEEDVKKAIREKADAEAQLSYTRNLVCQMRLR